GCADCQQALEQLAGADAHWAGLAANGRDEPAADGALQRVMARLKGEGTETDAGKAAGKDPSLTFLDPPARPGQLRRLGHYDVLAEIGRGGMGIVFRGFDNALHRVVAIKVLYPHLATSATARKRFVREAQAAAAVSHEHVVTIHAVDEANNPPYLVMQYVAG